MAACPTCGTENPDRARFCLDCGTALGSAPEERRESRRVVTVLFTDIVGSTALGEALDAETLRGVMARYFAAMEAAILRHGGTVEKFIGDAVMAVFGLPQLHEDDALRAVRAAAEMRRALAELNERFEADHGIAIRARTGVNTGEVVAGPAGNRQLLVTGDAVNTAARLEQAATAGEILLGHTTWQLVRDAAAADPVDPVAAKGKQQPVRAYRLVSVTERAGGPDRAGERARGADAVGRGANVAPARDGPLVGRAAELTRVEAVFSRVVLDRQPTLLSVIGPPGVGKSRLVAEFVDGLAGRARVLRGRCLSYGEGLTYWPLRELIHAAAGIEETDTPADALRKVLGVTGAEGDGPLIADRLASAIGLTRGAVAGEEIFWAARRTLERLASDGPLVVVFEDIHWAEATFLELLEHLREQTGAVPLLILCPARPELLDANPAWADARPNGDAIRLEGLSPAASDSLIDAVPGGRAVPQRLRDRLLSIAEGNPLFVEEMVRLLLDTGAVRPEGGAATLMDDAEIARVDIPPTIQALMSSRLDQLPGPERRTAQRGSIVGRVFEASAVTTLTPETARANVAEHLDALVRKDLVRLETGEARQDAPVEATGLAFKFRHILIRDAAYDALPKSERAELHEAFADWLEAGAGERVGEYTEILGHHLEQAYRYRTELRDAGEPAQAVGRRAAARLAEAGERARDRGDVVVASQLFARAGGLPAAGVAARLSLLLDWSDALLSAGLMEDSLRRVQEALALAVETGDRAVAARARLLRSEVWLTDGTLVSPGEGVSAEVDAALVDAEASGDARALADAWQARATLTYLSGRLEESAVEMSNALEHAHATGDAPFVLRLELNRLTEAVVGPDPASEVAALANQLLARTAAYPSNRADALRLLSIMEAMLGRNDEALRHMDESIAIMSDLRQPGGRINCKLDRSWLLRLAGDLPAAEIELRGALVEIDRLGDLTLRSFGASRLAVVLVAQGKLEDAVPFIEEADRIPSVTNRTRMVGARARIRAANGDPGAREDADRVLEMVADSAFISVKTDAWIDAAEVMAALGDHDAALRNQREALRLAEQKENLALAAQLRRRLAEMEAAAAAAG
ncbi:MAG: hypothetical protein QOH61_219 [Chloroflexota bacterium]|jgi:class 3 adenylate cyclase|nr:hypothetical protein [Chloroflexota bacterium]